MSTASIHRPAAIPRPPAGPKPQLDVAANVLTANELADRADPLRILALRFALVLLFLRLSMLHQLLPRLLHVHLYLLYLFGPPAILGMIFCGGLRRTFEGKAAFFWTAYAGWMVLSCPFSTWKMGSLLQTTMPFLRNELPMMFVIGGLVVTWKEFRQVLWVFVISCGINLMSSRYFEAEVGGRLALDFGSVANSNDFAAHLLYVLPILLWVVLACKSAILRIMALGGIAFGVYLILGTASRGAAIALGCVVLYFLWHASPAQRLAAITLAPVGLVILLSILPQTLVQRIKSFSDTEGASEEALESSRSREYVLRKSIEYTLHNPIFGLGPGQFANYEGTHNVVLGGHGYWHSTHNCVTQASSEMGIPAALFLLGGFFSTMGSFRRVYRSTKFRPECRDINVAALTLGMAFVGFFVAIIFLNFAYFFYTPAMAGVAIALERAGGAELRLRKPEVPVPFPWQPRVAV